MRLRYTLLPGLAALLIGSAAAVKAQETPKVKTPAFKTEKADPGAAKKEADTQMQKSKKQAEEMQKQQAKKADQVRKEADKGSEKGQAMREEHSKKWWKFWGQEPAAE